MKNLTILFLALTVLACTPKEEKVDLKKQVMEVHDEVMPKMGELRSTAQKLEAKMADTNDSLLVAEYRMLIAGLSDANEGMMVWMRNFDPAFEGSEEEVETYLQGQLKDVQQVKEDMLDALDSGREALK